MSALGNRIVVEAKKYIEQKEKPNNSGFIDPVFEKLMKSVGWSYGQSWCVYNAEAAWVAAFQELAPESLHLVKKYFSGSALQTYRNFKASPEFAVRKAPMRGGLLLWQFGSSQQGHAGICSNVYPSDIVMANSIEGNTSAAGSREGVEVAEKVRKLELPFNAKGLNYLGCVYPDRIA